MALGCGSNTSLVVTDQKEMFDLMDTNIRLNKLEGRAKALVLNWYVLPPPPMLPVRAVAVTAVKTDNRHGWIGSFALPHLVFKLD